jgi:hemerythrin-like domain-containing protein
MTPTQTLKHEHDIILHVLDAAEREVETMQSTGTIHANEVEKIVDFVRNFADRCHHAKEEKLLFVRLGELGMPTDGGPVGVMLNEHEMGRRYIGAVAAALPGAHTGNASAIHTIEVNLSGYIELLRSHIYKENNILFPMADRLLSPQDQVILEQEFARVETEEIGEGVHEKYHQLAHELMAS